MKKTYYVILFAFVGLILMIYSVQTIYSQEINDKKVNEFAQTSLEGYVKFLTEKNVTKYGFKNLAAAQNARLGEPFKVMIIGLNDLKDYNQGSGAQTLLIDAKTLWFPVKVDGEIKTKMEIVEKNGKLIASEFGGIQDAQKIGRVKDQLPNLIEMEGIQEPFEVMLVKIPSLSATFFYIKSPQEEYFISAMLQPQLYELEDLKIYTADDLLSKLRKYAEEIDETKLK